ncbi:MAG: zinc-ribbon domain-containing protein [Acidobacteria bacterium]|nr:zinc-ribbon domain-containing protein [Acidobacteriota bacterium]
MIVECPKCHTKYRLDPKQLAGRAQVQVRCTKCQSTFAAQTEAPSGAGTKGTGTMAAMPEATLVSQPGADLLLPTDKRLSLSVTGGPHKGKVFPITKPRMVLGRAGSDIVIDDAEVSRSHCALEIRGAKATVVDLGSTNGTYVSGQRVDSGELEHLTEFRVGGTTLVFTVFEK